jgi:predicted SAM-dependent methyltransferase
MSGASRVKEQPARLLHIGAGRARLEGWTNVDIQALPGVDVVADVTKGLHFTNVEALFAEHFLEHLDLADAVSFLSEAHRIMKDGAWMRLSTPNLDWVWITHYSHNAPSETKTDAALRLNRAFHGWRHRFLWNREILGQALTACGFDQVRWCRYGESEQSVFQHIERHDTYQDVPELPHVIIAEARRGEAQPKLLAEFRELVTREFLQHLAD